MCSRQWCSRRWPVDCQKWISTVWNTYGPQMFKAQKMSDGKGKVASGMRNYFLEELLERIAACSCWMLLTYPQMKHKFMFRFCHSLCKAHTMACDFLQLADGRPELHIDIGSATDITEDMFQICHGSHDLWWMLCGTQESTQIRLGLQSGMVQMSRRNGRPRRHQLRTWHRTRTRNKPQ